MAMTALKQDYDKRLFFQSSKKHISISTHAYLQTVKYHKYYPLTGKEKQNNFIEDFVVLL